MAKDQRAEPRPMQPVSLESYSSPLPFIFSLIFAGVMLALLLRFLAKIGF